MVARNLIFSKKKYRILAVILLGITFLFLFTFRQWVNSSIAFEHSKWIEAKSSGTWNIRKRMAQNLLEKKTLMGKSKAEVIILLGEPEKYSDVPANELYYTIDLDYGKDIDPVKVKYLIIYLDSKDQVAEAIQKFALHK